MLALRTVRGLDLDSLTPAERAGLKQTTLEGLSRVGKLIVDAGRIRIPAADPEPRLQQPFLPLQLLLLPHKPVTG